MLLDIGLQKKKIVYLNKDVDFDLIQPVSFEEENEWPISEVIDVEINLTTSNLAPNSRSEWLFVLFFFKNTRI